MRVFFGTFCVMYLLCCAALTFWYAPNNDAMLYWLYSQHLAWGYADCPPLIGWVTRAFSVALDNHIAVFGILRTVTSLLTAWGLYAFTRLFYEKRIGWLVAMAWLATPAVVHVFMTHWSYHSLTAVFWVWTLYTAYQAFLKQKPIWFYATGLCLTGLLYAQYEAIFLLVSLLLCALLLRPFRPLWRNPHTYFGMLLLPFILYLPHLWWLSQHHWGGLSFLLSDHVSHGQNAWFYGTSGVLNDLGVNYNLFFLVGLWVLWKTRHRFRACRQIAYGKQKARRFRAKRIQFEANGLCHLTKIKSFLNKSNGICSSESNLTTRSSAHPERAYLAICAGFILIVYLLASLKLFVFSFWIAPFYFGFLLLTGPLFIQHYPRLFITVLVINIVIMVANTIGLAFPHWMPGNNHSTLQRDLQQRSAEMISQTIPPHAPIMICSNPHGSIYTSIGERLALLRNGSQQMFFLPPKYMLWQRQSVVQRTFTQAPVSYWVLEPNHTACDTWLHTLQCHKLTTVHLGEQYVVMQCKPSVYMSSTMS